MMNDPEKSDSAIVAEKSANKAGQLAAEPMEPRAEAEGNADQQRTRRAQDRESVSQALDRIRWPRQERRRSSPRSSTISASRCSGWRSSRSSGKRHPAWTG